MLKEMDFSFTKFNSWAYNITKDTDLAIIHQFNLSHYNSLKAKYQDYTTGIVKLMSFYYKIDIPEQYVDCMFKIMSTYCSPKRMAGLFWIISSSGINLSGRRVLTSRTCKRFLETTRLFGVKSPAKWYCQGLPIALLNRNGVSIYFMDKLVVVTLNGKSNLDMTSDKSMYIISEFYKALGGQ